MCMACVFREAGIAIMAGLELLENDPDFYEVTNETYTSLAHLQKAIIAIELLQQNGKKVDISSISRGKPGGKNSASVILMLCKPKDSEPEDDSDDPFASSLLAGTVASIDGNPLSESNIEAMFRLEEEGWYIFQIEREPAEYDSPRGLSEFYCHYSLELNFVDNQLRSIGGGLNPNVAYLSPFLKEDGAGFALLSQRFQAIASEIEGPREEVLETDKLRTIVAPVIEFIYQ